MDKLVAKSSRYNSELKADLSLTNNFCFFFNGVVYAVLGLGITSITKVDITSYDMINNTRRTGSYSCS